MELVPQLSKGRKSWEHCWKVLNGMENPKISSLWFCDEALKGNPVNLNTHLWEFLLFLYAWRICILLSKLIAECAEAHTSLGLKTSIFFKKFDQYEKLLSLYNDHEVKSKLHLHIIRAFKANADAKGL